MKASPYALDKIKKYRECLAIKKQYHVSEFYIYNITTRYGYGISASNKWENKHHCKLEKTPVGLTGILERMTSNLYKVWYLDEEMEFDNLDDFLEYYYITKIAGLK